MPARPPGPADPHGRGSLGRRLRRTRARHFVGRTHELDHFRRALTGEPDTARVLIVHGPGGLGKSTLLEQVAHEAADAGRAVTRVDAGPTSPAPSAAVAPPPFTLGNLTAPAVLELARQGLATAAADAPSAYPVLVVDSLDRCPGLEGLLRRELLPTLPEESVVVLAGREVPEQEWTADPGWRELVAVLPLPPLDPEESAELLLRREVPADEQPRLLEFAGGNPLALCLSADDLGRHSGPWHPEPELVQSLLARLVDPATQREHALALAVCSLSRSTTIALLRVAMNVNAATAEFGWLASLSCVQVTPTGLRLDALTQRLFEESAQWSDRLGYEQLRRTIWTHQTERVLTGGPHLEEALLELGHLSRHHHPTGGDPLAGTVELDLGDQLVPTVLRLAETAGGAPDTLRYWLGRQPEAFTVYGRPEDHRPVSFLAWLRLSAPEESDLQADPLVAAAWRQVAGDASWSPGEEVAVARFLASDPPVPTLSPVDPRLVRWHAEVARASRRLAVTYVALPLGSPWEACMVGLDHHPSADIAPVRLEGRDWQLFEHDWRQVPLASFLTRVFPNSPRPEPPDSRTAQEWSREEFDEAVRQLLRQWRDDDAVAANPLTRSRLGTDGPGEDPVDAVRSVIARVVDGLQDDPRTVKYHRALAATYLTTSLTQEAAAVRLGLPFGTFRHHLAKGTTVLADLLWQEWDHTATAV